MLHYGNKTCQRNFLFHLNASVHFIYCFCLHISNYQYTTTCGQSTNNSSPYLNSGTTGILKLSDLHSSFTYSKKHISFANLKKSYCGLHSQLQQRKKSLLWPLPIIPTGNDWSGIDLTCVSHLPISITSAVRVVLPCLLNC